MGTLCLLLSRCRLSFSRSATTRNNCCICACESDPFGSGVRSSAGDGVGDVTGVPHFSLILGEVG